MKDPYILVAALIRTQIPRSSSSYPAPVKGNTFHFITGYQNIGYAGALRSFYPHHSPCMLLCAMKHKCEGFGAKHDQVHDQQSVWKMDRLHV
jgi:hypothetical protein